MTILKKNKNYDPNPGTRTYIGEVRGETREICTDSRGRNSGKVKWDYINNRFDSPRSQIEDDYESVQSPEQKLRDQIKKEPIEALVLSAMGIDSEVQEYDGIDIPMRSTKWIVEHMCDEIEHGKKSSAFKLDDYKCMTMNDGKMTPNFKRVANKVLVSANVALNFISKLEGLTDDSSVFTREQLERDLSNNPYIIMLMKAQDSVFGDVNKNGVALKILYRVREHFDVHDDFGFKTGLGFVSESDFSDDSISAEEIFPSLYERLTSCIGSAGKTANQYMREVTDFVFRSIKGVFGFIGATVEILLDPLRRRLNDLVAHVCGLGIKRSVDEAYGTIIKGVGMIIGALCIGILSGLSTVALFRVLAWMFPVDNVSEGPGSPTGMILAFVTYFFGSSEEFKASLKKHCLFLVSIMAGGSILDSFASTLFFLLPTTLRLALINKFGTRKQKLKMKLDVWRNKASVLNAVHTTQNVAGTEYFSQRLKETMREGETLFQDLGDSRDMVDLKTPFIPLYTKLMKIQVNVTQKEFSQASRPMPFSFHVSGEPGVGKSLMTETLLRRSMNVKQQDVFAVPVASEYWDGYQGQSTILMDEFLVGGDETKDRQKAKEYLQLVSVQRFMPPLASVDSPAVGIKGTTCSPEVVVTLNNTKYNRVSGVNDSALQRRRQFVVHCEWVPNVKKDGNNVRLSEYDVTKFDWMQFQILDSQHNAALSDSPRITFDELCAYIRSARKEHEEVCKNITESLGGSLIESKSPEQIINEVLRSSFDIPTEPITIYSAIKGMFTSKKNIDEMISEGSKNRHHKHNCKSCELNWNCAGRLNKCSLFRGKDSKPTHELDSCADCSDAGPNYEGDSSEFHSMLSESEFESEGDHVEPLPQSDGSCPVNEEMSTSEMTLRDYFTWKFAKDITCAFPGALVSKSKAVASSLFAEDDETRHVAVGATCVAVLALLYGIRKVFTGESEEEEGEGDKITFEAQSQKPNKSRNNSRKSYKMDRGLSYDSEGSVSVPKVELDFGVRTIHAIPIKEKIFVTYLHGLYEGEQFLPDGCDVSIRNRGTVYKTSFYHDSCVPCHDMDLVFIRFDDARVPMFKDISSKFMRSSDASPGMKIKTVLQKSGGLSHSRAELTCNQNYRLAGLNRRQELPECWVYQTVSSSGDCGSPLIVSQGMHVGKILGIHVAGSGIKTDYSKGIASLTTYEFIQDGLEQFAEFLSEAPEGSVFDNTVEFRNAPNVRKAEKLMKNEVVFISNKSKLKKSFLNGRLQVKASKAPAIMSVSDPRSRGIEPISNSLRTLCEAEHPKVDPVEMDSVFDSIQKKLNRIDFPVGKRQLSFTEACKGVPQHLASLNTKTSPGYPLVCVNKKKGKTDFVWFDENGDLGYTAEFERLVKEKIDVMESYDPENKGSVDHRFLGFMKDELVSTKKINNVKTRMTFANNLVSIVAFRIKFGSILAAINQSFETTGFAIGLNQYSHDMGAIYNHLSKKGTKFIAGDFSEFDKRFHPEFRARAYKAFGLLCSDYCDFNSISYFIEHECNSPAQIGDLLIHLKSNNMSGCFLTTIVNCIVNEAYMRWSFQHDFPHLIFDREVAMTILGDDHLISTTPACTWTPADLQKTLSLIGQKYTSAFKDREIENYRSQFGDVMFLGARPRVVNGQWSGALKKATLYETVQWTRDGEFSLDQVVVGMVELASQWDESFFDTYHNDLQQAYASAGRQFPDFPSYLEMRRVVSHRTAASGLDFVSEGPMDSTASGNMGTGIDVVRGIRTGIPPAPVTTVAGLTTIKTADAKPNEDYERSDFTQLASKSVNEKRLDLEYGLNSLVKRQTYTWSFSQNRGDTIGEVQVPFGLLDLGNGSNIQNMPYLNYIYHVTEVEIVLQVNSLPTMAGAAVGFFDPFSSSGSITTPVGNCTSFNHIFLTPDDNSTKSIRIPYRFYRSCMNTYAEAFGTETLGRFKIFCYSPLASNTGSDVSITLFSRFIAKFTIPRPIPDVESVSLRSTVSQEVRDKFSSTGRRREPLFQGNLQKIDTFVSEGATYSTSNVNNSYSVGDVAGDVPFQGSTDASSSATMEVQASASGLPMDNPPLSGGAIPTFNQFSSMSKSNGIEPTISMQLHQQMMHREPLGMLDKGETSLEYILSRRGYVTTLNWDTTQVEGTSLISIPLNSILAEPTTIPIQGSLITLPPNLAMLNEFLRFRADFEFEFMAVRTRFHSGRLLATVAYGAPDIAVGEQNVFYNSVLEFNGENSWESVKVNYNAQTEFLRTYEGTRQNDPVQDHSLGILNISVANELRASSDVVANSVEVLVFVKLRNVRIYEAKPIRAITYAFYGSAPFMVDNAALAAKAEEDQLVSEGEKKEVRAHSFSRGLRKPAKNRGQTLKELSLVSEGPEGSSNGTVEETEATPADLQQPDVVEMTESHSNVQTDRPCKLEVGRKFEYTVTNIHELLRRHVLIDPFITEDFMTGRGGFAFKTFAFDTLPNSPIGLPFATWSGHLKYRIYVYDTEPALVAYMSGSDTTVDSSPFVQNFFAFAMAPGGTEVKGNLTVVKNRNQVDYFPMEMTAPLNNSCSFIDVSIPFNTQMNVLATAITDNDLGNRRNGRLYIRTRNDSSVRVEIFQAVGDDFRYGVYRPTQQAFLRPYSADTTITPDPANYLQIGDGLWNGPTV